MPAGWGMNHINKNELPCVFVLFSLHSAAAASAAPMTVQQALLPVLSNAGKAQEITPVSPQFEQNTFALNSQKSRDFIQCPSKTNGNVRC